MNRRSDPRQRGSRPNLFGTLWSHRAQTLEPNRNDRDILGEGQDRNAVAEVAHFAGGGASSLGKDHQRPVLVEQALGILERSSPAASLNREGIHAEREVPQVILDVFASLEKLSSGRTTEGDP